MIRAFCAQGVCTRRTHIAALGMLGHAVLIFLFE
jgi:hypothetical protein